MGATSLKERLGAARSGIWHAQEDAKIASWAGVADARRHSCRSGNSTTCACTDLRLVGSSCHLRRMCAAPTREPIFPRLFAGGPAVISYSLTGMFHQLTCTDILRKPA